MMFGKFYARYERKHLMYREIPVAMRSYARLMFCFSAICVVSMLGAVVSLCLILLH